MNTTLRKLVVVITETALETILENEIVALGAHGYTISDARGSGSHGRREATWEGDHNIRIEVICDQAVAEAIVRTLQEKYYDEYAMTIYVLDVGVFRPEKF
jgi:nitrogen regulatory protein PII